MRSVDVVEGLDVDVDLRLEEVVGTERYEARQAYRSRPIATGHSQYDHAAILFSESDQAGRKSGGDD